jgi:4-amino-4-deoxy-L-arabinose transferase-like glycosyltransferase
VSSIPYRRLLPWLGLLSIGTLFVIAVVRVHPSNFFGYSEDDAIYFSSAKALAEGKGYVIESFPGTPAETKYPVFYPWILSWVWRWNPSFPSNLSDAIAVTVAFGLLYLTMAFLFLRQLNGFSELEALLLTAFCALHPRVIFSGGQVLSDIPFAALALGAMVLAQKAERPGGGRGSAACSGVLAGLAMVMRVLGVPVAAGIAAALAARRSWRQLAVFCRSVAPFFVVLAWRVIFPRLALSPVSGAAASSPTWVDTWAYYTNYLHVWKQAVPSAFSFAASLKESAIFLLRAPADYFASPWPAAHTFLGEVIAIVVTWIIVKGVARLSRDSRVGSLSWVLAFYAAVVFLWVYVDDGRFLILFLPVFAAALWIEGRHVAKLVWIGLTSTQRTRDQLVAAAWGVVVAVFVCAVFVDYAGGLRKKVAELSEERASILQEKREAYDWLARSTDRRSRVIAMEDGSLYLYSERAAVRPVTFADAHLYEPSRIERAPQTVTDVARAIGAEYWLVSDDDYNSAWPETALNSRTNDTAQALPLLYHSVGGHVRIYSLRCFEQREDSSCE